MDVSMELFMRIVLGPKEDIIWPNNNIPAMIKYVIITKFFFHENNSRSKERLLFVRTNCQYLIIALRVPITN